MKKRMLALVLVCCLTAGQMVFAAEEVYPVETVPADGTVEMGENQTESPGEEETGKEESLQQSGPESSADNGETTPEAQEITIYIANASDPVTIDMTREEYEAGVSIEYQDMDVCSSYKRYYRDDEQKLYLEFSANMPGETDIKIWNSSKDRLYAYYHATAVYEEMAIYLNTVKRINTTYVFENVDEEEWTLTTSDASVCTGNTVFEAAYGNYKSCYLELEGHASGSAVIEVRNEGFLKFAYQVTVTELPDNVIVFPDKNLENKLIDFDQDGYITKEELAEKEYLYFANSGISDLTGLEWAVNLKDIDLSGNTELKNVDALFGLENLSYINLQNTGVSMADRWELADVNTTREICKGEMSPLTSKGMIFDTYPDMTVTKGEGVVEFRDGAIVALEAGDAVCSFAVGNETKEIQVHVEGIPSDQTTGPESDLDVLQSDKELLLDSSGKLWQLYPEVTGLKENVKSYVAGWIYSGKDALTFRYDVDQDGVLWNGEQVLGSNMLACTGHYALDADQRLTDIYNTDAVTLENVKDWKERVWGFEGQQMQPYTYVLKNDGTLWRRMEVEKDAQVQEFQLVDEGVTSITQTTYLKDNSLYYFTNNGTSAYLTGVAEYVSDADRGTWYIGTDGNTYLYVSGSYINIGNADVKSFVYDSGETGNSVYYLTEDNCLYHYVEGANAELIDEEVTELKRDLTYQRSVYRKADGLYRYCKEGKTGTKDNPVYVNCYGYELKDCGVPGDYTLVRNGVELLTHVKEFTMWQYAIRTDGTVWNVAKVPEKILDLDGGTYVRGDANGDGIVDISDLRMVLRKVCKKTEFDSTQMTAADVTDDGNVDIQDLRKILRFVCKKITEL